MAFSVTINHELIIGGATISRSTAYSANAQNNLSEAIADSTTDGELTWAMDVSELVYFFMYASGTLLVETNNGSTPDHSFSLTSANQIVWTDDSGLTNPFDTTDITSLFVTNASGASVTLTIYAGYDPSP